MCYPEKCRKCGRTGWAGCGQHADDVMRALPVSQRCTCERNSAPEATDSRRVQPNADGAELAARG